MATKSESGLMSKKKAELIDIILRKDDVERELRKELENTKLDFEKSKKMYTNCQNQLDACRSALESAQRDVNSYQSVIDDAVLDDANNKHYIKLYKRLTILFAVTTVIAIALIFVL